MYMYIYTYIYIYIHMLPCPTPGSSTPLGGRTSKLDIRVSFLEIQPMGDGERGFLSSLLSISFGGPSSLSLLPLSRDLHIYIYTYMYTQAIFKFIKSFLLKNKLEMNRAIPPSSIP
jgi:ABC-type phosphate transport system substrate-binding protein